MGPTCPKTSVSNYHCTLRNVSEGLRSCMMIWQCRPWFGSTWSGSEQSGLALHARIEDNLTYLSAKCKEKTSSCSWVNTVIHMTFSCPTTEWLSSWSRFFLEKLTCPQQVKIFCTFIEPGGCCVYRSPSLVCTLSHMNKVHAFPSRLFKFRFNILPSTVFMEVILLCLLLIKLHYQHCLTWIQIVPWLVCYMFQPVLVLS